MNKKFVISKGFNKGFMTLPLLMIITLFALPWSLLVVETYQYYALVCEELRFQQSHYLAEKGCSFALVYIQKKGIDEQIMNYRWQEKELPFMIDITIKKDTNLWSQNYKNPYIIYAKAQTKEGWITELRATIIENEIAQTPYKIIDISRG